MSVRLTPQMGVGRTTAGQRLYPRVPAMPLKAPELETEEV
jgi:hypothetical protein